MTCDTCGHQRPVMPVFTQQIWKRKITWVMCSSCRLKEMRAE